MPLPAVLAIIAAAGALGGAAFFLSQDARTRRKLRRLPVVTISAARDGEVVRVTGRLLPLHELLKAPLSGRDCAYYVARAEERPGSDPTTAWRTLAREERGVDFRVEDGTGVAHVVANPARVALVRDVDHRSGTFDDASATEEAFLARHGLKSTNELGLNRTLRFREGALIPGEPVTVSGRARWDTLPSGRRQLTIVAPAGGELLVSDDPRTVQR